jgi:hypothetical protein
MVWEQAMLYQEGGELSVRSDDDKLRTCPTCSTPVKDAKALGLRDYTWLSGQLPGKMGLTDGDAFLERKGEVLMFEFKPQGQGIPLGQRIFLKVMVRKGIHVWCVWEQDDGSVEVGAMDRAGEVPFVEHMPLRKFIAKVVAWEKAANDGEL